MQNICFSVSGKDPLAIQSDLEESLNKARVRTFVCDVNTMYFMICWSKKYYTLA